MSVAFFPHISQWKGFQNARCLLFFNAIVIHFNKFVLFLSLKWNKDFRLHHWFSIIFSADWEFPKARLDSRSFVSIGHILLFLIEKSAKNIVHSQNDQWKWLFTLLFDKIKERERHLIICWLFAFTGHFIHISNQTTFNSILFYVMMLIWAVWMNGDSLLRQLFVMLHHNSCQCKQIIIHWRYNDVVANCFHVLCYR